jgi:nitrite reductase/ring-hydroxylating ferredoxin subunit
MLQYERVADAGAIEPGTAKPFSIGRYDIAVFNIDGDLFALENACPHQGGPIADGSLEGSMVTCPWHAWCFDVRTGRMTLGDFATIPRFDVRIEDGSIFVSTEPMDDER